MRHVICLALVGIVSAASLQAGEWPNWRGPNSNGVANGTGYPTSWNEDDIAWKAELNGVGASTPAVFGDAIFVTTTDHGRNIVSCLGLDGKGRWEKELGSSIEGKQGEDGTEPIRHQ